MGNSWEIEDTLLADADADRAGCAAATLRLKTATRTEVLPLQPAGKPTVLSVVTAGRRDGSER